MKKRFGILLLILMFGLITAASASPAPDISLTSSITLDGKKFNTKEMLDRRYSTYTKVSKGKGIVIENSRPISGVFLQFYDRATSVEIQVEANGVWETIATGGTHLSDYFEVPQNTTRVRIANTSKARLFLAELTVYGEGDRPGNAATWQDCEKADLMLLVAHPDDELLWFGGLLPTYAGERGLDVQVIYAVNSTPLRRLELLDGLWHCGVTNYPAFLGLRDVRSKTMNDMYSKWGKNKVFAGLTEMIRKYQPEVLVTQDYQGEYGHGAHRVVADAAERCIPYAATPSKYPESAKSYGTHQVKKLYVHLADTNPIQLDWHQPLARFDGKDGMQIAIEALDYHQSQTRNGWQMTEGGKTDNTRFGLVFTTVGTDEQGDDLMEHITEDDDHV